VPREHKVRVGSLARRAGVPYLSLRLLAPLVRPSGKKIGDATPAEKAEYAGGLIYVGASSEALEILQSMGKHAPLEASLFTSFALFAQWEYAKAIPVLSHYVQAVSLGDYPRLVGKVNLAAALVTERNLAAADKLLKEIERESREGQHQLLHGVILLLSAQSMIFQKNWGEADGFLRLAQEKLQASDSLEALFVRKWQAIVNLLQEKKGSQEKIQKVKEEALSRGHGETVRDLDRFLALQGRDEALFVHVYFGTPYESFRGRLVADADFKVTLPSRYELKLGEGQRNPKAKPVWIDVAKGAAGPDREGLKFNAHLHRLLRELCHDFYQSSSLTALHARVYEGEYFNPISTPSKMHRLIVRFREWLKAEKIPLELLEKRSNYRLVGKSPCSLHLQERSVAPSNPLLDELQTKFIDDKFSIKQAVKALSTPTRSTLRLLEKGMAEGRLAREGRASATRYRFLKKAS